MLPDWLTHLLFDPYTEAYWTYDLAEKTRIGAKLHAARIPYRIRVQEASGPKRTARGSIPMTEQNNDFLCHYTFLIRRSLLVGLPPSFFHDLPR